MIGVQLAWNQAPSFVLFPTEEPGPRLECNRTLCRTNSIRISCGHIFPELCSHIVLMLSLITGEVFSRVLKVIRFGFALLYTLRVGQKNSRHFFNQIRKRKNHEWLARDFPALDTRHSHAFASNFDWFAVFLVSDLISQTYCFSFGFYDTQLKTVP